MISLQLPPALCSSLFLRYPPASYTFSLSRLLEYEIQGSKLQERGYPNEKIKMVFQGQEATLQLLLEELQPPGLGPVAIGRALVD